MFGTIMGRGPVGNALVVTIDFGAESSLVAATVTDYDLGRVEVLALPSGSVVDQPSETVHDAIARAVTAGARCGGVLTAPDALVLTHPPSWTPEEIAVLFSAAEAAGYERSAVIVRPRVGAR
ncbi:hypothetical protein HQO83_06895 [Rhodococcus fascians]|nr:hypothetical protein [Rhodococcus fascians]